MIVALGTIAMTAVAMGFVAREVLFGTWQRKGLTMGVLVLCVLWWRALV